MKTKIATVALALGLFLVCVAGAPAQQQPLPEPGRNLSNNAEMWRGARQGVQGYVSIPNKQAGVLVQSEGENWRNLRNGPISTYGTWLLLGIVVALALFFALRGRIRIEAGPSPNRIKRFGAVERFSHWLTAVTFILLGLTGLNMLYGRYVIRPLVGPDVFSALTAWGKYVHNYISFAFMLGIVLLVLLWLRDNLPTRADLKWLAMGGGLLSKGSHPPAHKFNAGQKLIFCPVLRRRHARDAADAARPQHRRPALHRHDHRAYLHRHDRHGGRLRRDEFRHGRRELGARAPQFVGRRDQGRETIPRPRPARSRPA